MADFTNFTDEEVEALAKAMTAGFATGILDTKNPVHDILDLNIWNERVQRQMVEPAFEMEPLSPSPDDPYFETME